MKQSSLFDIISPIMVGPSSSHTAGAVRLGLMARNIYDFQPEKVTFRLYNSYAETGRGHGTDKGLLAGVLGFSVDDIRIKDIFNSEESKRFEYSFEFLEDFNRHPNAVDFIFEGKHPMTISGDSIGAGEISIKKINKFSVDLSGEYDTLVIIYKDMPGIISKVSNLIQNERINIASVMCDRSARGEEASMIICLDSVLNYSVVQKIKQMEDIYLVRQVGKLES